MTAVKKDIFISHLGKSDNLPTSQVRIDRKWHSIAKLYAKKSSRTLRSLLEEGLAYVIPTNFTLDNPDP